MDDADRADFNIERELEWNVSRREPNAPPATGRCLNCDEPLPLSRRWCQADCRDDWERTAKGRAISPEDEDWWPY